ncbi:hypothetical protein EMCRGX_G003735 [Ephydatia muelleri]
MESTTIVVILPSESHWASPSSSETLSPHDSMETTDGQGGTLRDDHNITIVKESESPSEPPSSSPLVQRVNPERAARDRVLDSNATAETPEKEDISQVSSSQAHILDVLELMGCKEHESSVRRLPHIDNRCQVVNASEADIDATAMQRVDNVFLRGVKAWIHLLLPNLKLKCDSKLKAVCSIMSMAEEQLIAGQSTD